MSNVSTVRVELSLCSSRPSSQGFDWRPSATVLLVVRRNDACTIGLAYSQSASIFPNFVSYCFHLECLGAKIWPAVERKMHNYWSGQRLLTSFVEASRFFKDEAELGTWGIHVPSSSLILLQVAFLFPWEFLHSIQVKSDFVFLESLILFQVAHSKGKEHIEKKLNPNLIHWI